jgi:hypothetical protein
MPSQWRVVDTPGGNTADGVVRFSGAAAAGPNNYRVRERASPFSHPHAVATALFVVFGFLGRIARVSRAVFRMAPFRRSPFLGGRRAAVGAFTLTFPVPGESAPPHS